MDDQGDDMMIRRWEFVPGLEGENLVWFFYYLDGVSFPSVSPYSPLDTGVYPLWCANVVFNAYGQQIAEN